MRQQPYLLDWNIWMGGTRKGANITVKDPDSDRKISGTVTAWLNDEFQACSRKKAQYCLVERWSYGADTQDIPKKFCVSLEKPPVYLSKTFRPIEATS